MMQEAHCQHCSSSAIKTKRIEIRHINSRTMAIASQQQVTELECTNCGFIMTLDESAVACTF